MKKLFFLLFLFPFIVSAASPDIVIKQFVNKSEYKGKWNIGYGFSRMLKEKMLESHVTNVWLEKDVTNSDSKMIISGVIEKFKFREILVAAYKVGGHKTFGVEITVRLRIQYLPKSIDEKSLSEANISNISYGLTLLGGPGSTEDFEEDAYHNLQALPFGGDEYMKTIYGTASQDCMDKLVKSIFDVQKRIQ